MTKKMDLRNTRNTGMVLLGTIIAVSLIVAYVLPSLTSYVLVFGNNNFVPKWFPKMPHFFYDPSPDFGIGKHLPGSNLLPSPKYSDSY